jgi:hypothetical protein
VLCPFPNQSVLYIRLQAHLSDPSPEVDKFLNLRGGCDFPSQRLNPSIVSQFLGHRFILPSDQLEEVRCQVAWSLPIQPAMVLELCFDAVTNHHSGGRLKQQTI